jgi:hypothetical protein
VTQGPAVRCLDDELSEYAAGRLPAPRVRVWERHLAVCDLCAVGLRRERRLRAVLAGGPSMPGDLREALIAMGRGLGAPSVPGGAGPEPLALLTPTAPPCHRSPLRATVVAAAAAGVSAAAAWSLTVIGAPSPARPGAVAPPAVRNAASSPASPTTGTATPGPTRWTSVGVALLVTDEEAQSTP